MKVIHETIDHATLACLAEAGAIQGASITGQGAGWGVVIQYGMSERALAAKRGALRTFRKFETLVSYLRSLGIVRYQVDASAYNPSAPHAQRRRADAAERMKHAHEAAAYDDWLKTKVAGSLAALQQGTNQELPADEWAKIRAAKQARPE